MSQNQEDNNQPTEAWTALLNATDEDTKVIPILRGDLSTAVIFKRVPATIAVTRSPRKLDGFPMGDRRLDRASPVIRVVIEQDYWISAFPITQLQWRQAIELGAIKKLRPQPSHFKGDYLPVEQVSWVDVQLWLSGLRELIDFGETKFELRLPYEAEWEWACRAVPFGPRRNRSSVAKLKRSKNPTSRSETFFRVCTWEFNGLNHFGDDERALKKCGWFASNSERSTHRVGQKDPNPLGLYDMHGNVWERCEGPVLKNYSAYWDGITMQELIVVNSTRKNEFSVIRGGSWSSSAECCRSANRDWRGPNYRNGNLGFRVGLFPGPNRAQASNAQADSEQRREAETLLELFG